VVLVRKDGPIRQRYEALGIPCLYMPDLPTFRPGDRKNLIAFCWFVWGLRRFPVAYRRIKGFAQTHNVRIIHVNHESFALTGYLLSRLLGVPWIAHVRTTLTPGWFARRLCRLIAAKSSHAICIVQPVKSHFLTLTDKSGVGSRVSVVHNITPRAKAPALPYAPFNILPNRFRVLSLTNFSANRGVDRIVDVAEILHRRGDHRFAFYLCGLPANTHAITGRPDPYYQSIRSRVEKCGIEEMVFFPGHVSEPERALISCNALIKLTRQSNPWGRDVMEALSAGVPVVTLGTFREFVENKVNGYIADQYRPEEIADYLQKIAGDPKLRLAIAAANKAKAERLFSASVSASAVEDIYRRVLLTRTAVDKSDRSCVA
jgi:glycosyltransferase involved in cell wall biosynthesis